MKTRQKPTKSKAIIKLDFSKDHGFVKLQRSILRSPIFADANLFRVYIWCLLKANHTPKTFSIRTGKGSTLVECKRGTFITGRNKASDDLGISGSTFRSYLTRIQKLGLLKQMPKAHYTIVEVVNYDTQKTTNQTTNYSTNHVGKGQPHTTTKNEKNDENNKKIKKEKEKYSINKYLVAFNKLDQSKYNLDKLKEYRFIAKKIHSELTKIRLIPGILSIDDYLEIRQNYVSSDILNTLVLMNAHKNVKKYLSVKPFLINWLQRNMRVRPIMSRSNDDKEWIDESIDRMIANGELQDSKNG